MRWYKPNLRNSLHAIFSASLGARREEDDPVTLVTIEDIREGMLELLQAETSERATTVRRRIRYAVSVESLWFLRGELMAVLSRSRGESAALEQIAAISDMFDGLLPEGLRSRPSPLGRG
ncbi:hypothetical protein PE066_00585 [Ramlibacter tataouinensis]|uniref:hypothetical protein n=1 Tax=Ramlibacter tataouinensis TaxID=94132 RepID=UPI0022F3AEFE|nr:hypothetical protein [Ramlibacter tataouinensis]WBY02069.1 hypothetical protein PE066_00585 [Ramlibacter tataouinensis]